MQTIYKIFLVIFVVLIGFNVYQIDWKLGVTDGENAKFLYPLASGIIGLILVFVLNTWSKLKRKKLD